MKIHHKTKRGLNTLKFWGCSEILTLILREIQNRDHNSSILLLLGYRVGFEVPSMTCIWSSNSSTVAGGTPAATTHHPLPSRKKEEFSPSYVFGCETNAELLQRQVISKYPWSSY